MPFSDSPFRYDVDYWRDIERGERQEDALGEDHARDEGAQPQLPVQSRDDRRAAA